MATTSPLSATGRAAPRAPSLATRLRRAIAEGAVPGGDAAQLSGPRGDEFGFGQIEELIAGSHPEAVEPLRAVLGSRRLDRRSAVSQRWHIVNTIHDARALGYDVFDAGYEDAVDHLRWARLQGSVKGGPLSAGACKSIRAEISRLHRAAGNPDPFGAPGSEERIEVDRLIASWRKQDADATGRRPGAVGVAAKETLPTIGYLSRTAVTMGHVARMNARSGARPSFLLREQARVLLIRETHSSLGQLRWVTLADLRLGANPTVRIPDRTDGAGRKLPRDISVELARLLRVLRDDLRASGSTPDAPLFQTLVGGGDKRWSGKAMTTGNSDALRAMLGTAAEQATARGDETVGLADAIARLLARTTYESIRDGVITDCHALGLEPVQVAVFFKRFKGSNEIDALWAREDARVRGSDGS